MKILHYIPSIDERSGGVGAYIQLLSRELGKLCELHIITHKGENELPVENCKLHYIPYKYLPWGNCKRDFMAVLNEVNPDVFHSNSCWMPVSALSTIWAKNAGYKVVYTPHGMLEPYAIKRHFWTKKLPAIWLFQRRGIAMADWLHATAEMERVNLMNLGWNKKVFVIPNCIQIDHINLKQSWKRKKSILYLSRIHPKKGLNYLIDAVARLHNELREYKIIVAGPGDNSYIERLKLQAKERRVEELFKFIGPVFGNNKYVLYQNADLFVLPSLSENFGIVVPEALASGTPVITTFGTPWEELNSKMCGWYIGIGTEPLVEALRQFLLCSDDELERMGKRGRELVEVKYSSSIVANQFIGAYNSIINTQ